jgi:hypothetical protein
MATRKRLTQSCLSRHLAYWNERVACLSLKFKKLVADDAPKFVESLMSTFLTSSHNKDILRDGILSVSRHQKSIRWYEDEILQLGGVNSEWEEAHQLSGRVSEVVRWIEEALCLAMVDPEELVALHTAKQLMYQNA